MPSRTALWTAVAALSLVPLGSAAEPDAPMQGKRYENVRWFNVSHVDYFPSKAEEALRIVHEHFVPAATSSGSTMPRLLEYATGGAWDLTVISPMPDGPSEMEWEISPNSVKWFGALAEQVGGMEEAEALMNEYLGMVNRYESNLVRERLGDHTMAEVTD